MQNVGLNFRFFCFRIGAQKVAIRDLILFSKRCEIGGKFGARIDDGRHDLRKVEGLERKEGRDEGSASADLQQTCIDVPASHTAIDKMPLIFYGQSANKQREQRTAKQRG